MEIITSGIGDLVIQELREAIGVKLAVAFFCPDDRTFAALSAVPALSLVISEEFTVTDPSILKKLPTTASIRSVPTDAEEGKLHAKVLIVERSDHSMWVLLGSANTTHYGFFRNREACVAIDTRNSDDQRAVETLIEWFTSLLRTTRAPDLTLAQRIYDSRSLYRLELRTEASKPSPGDFWILKTRSGSDMMEHWDEFLAENVLAIGWEDIKVDPSNVSDDELRKSLFATYEDYAPRQADAAVANIRAFVSLKENDIVIVCRGYPSNQQRPVHVYALARVTGPFRADPYNGRKWRFKHKAAIQPVGIDLPKEEVASALKKDSLMQTIHESDRESFERFAKLLQREGVQVNI